MKYVRDYFIRNHAHGIVSLTFKTTEKWCSFHDLNDEEYLIYGDEYINGEDLYNNFKVKVNIKDFLDENSIYFRFSSQDKDYITFIFLPDDILTQ